MRVAVIDLGTNTFNLLIAEVNATGFTILHNSKIGVALGMGGINEGKINEEAIERAISTFHVFKEHCTNYQVEKIQAIGTSALRDAKNNNEFCQLIQDKFNISIEIIDGNKEADLIYEGISWSYNFPNSSLIMDIGGGSTEFIRIDEEKNKQQVSLNIGVSRVYQSFSFNDPFHASDIDKLKDWFTQNSDELNSWGKVKTLVGASGSFETFYEMIYQKSFPNGMEIVKIELTDLRKCLNEIIASTLKQRELHSWILPIRRKMAPIAAVKTLWIIDYFEIEEIIISPCSLKEGVLRRFIQSKTS